MQSRILPCEKRRDALKEQLDAEEWRHIGTIKQRDAAEDALADAYCVVTGEEAIWSNLFGYAEAINRIKDAIAAQRKA